MKRPLLIICVGIFTVVCLYLLYATYRQVKRDAISELNAQQRAHAKLAKAGIEGFVRQYMKILEHLSHHDDIVDLNETGKATMRAFYEASREDIRSITRIDADGTFVYTFPDNELFRGVTISHRDFFQAMKLDMKPVVSDVIDSIKGHESAVVLHVPVFKRGKFNGSVAIAVSIDDLSTRFLKDIRIGKTGYAWVLSRKGTELYCPVPGHIGVSIYDTSGRFPEVIAMAEEMMQGKEGVATYRYDYIAEQEIKTVKKHAVYMPITVGDTFWSIVVATPEDEALAAMEGFRDRWLLIAGLLAAGFLAFTFYIVRFQVTARETTKRIAIEEALVESEERYRSIFENALEGIYQSTAEGHLISANPALARMVGYDSPEEMIDDAHDIARQLYVNPGDREEVLAIIETKGYVAKHEVQFRRRDGNEIWVSLNASGVRDDSGKIVYYEGTVEDITERKTAEMMLREEMEFNATLLQTSPAFFVAMDAGAKVLLMNQSMLDALGYSINDALGKDYITNFVPEEDRKALSEVFRQIATSAMPTRNENNVLTKDGRKLLVEWRGRNVLDDRGELQYFFGVGIDITERRKAEEALYAEKDKLQNLLENAPFGMVLIGSEGRFTYVNSKFKEIFGYGLSDIPDGRTWFRMVYPEKSYRAKVISAWIEDFRSVGPGEKETRIFTVTCKDGKQKIISFITIKLNSGDALTVCEDITELRNLEAKLRQSQKMEAIGSLAGGIAHDFNNILTAIIGYASLVQQELDEGSRLGLYVEQILSASQKAADLTQSLLTFSRKQPVTLKPVDINNVVAGVQNLLARLLTEDIDLRLNLAEGDLTAMADTTQMDQIFFNLATNARDAMTKGGVFSIETGLVEMDSDLIDSLGFGQEGRYVRIMVTDTGIGMDEATQEKIFEPFFTTKEVGKGTGLGLATVYGIVKQHNGYITVDSESGRGTTFSIYIPAIYPVAGEGVPAPPSVQTGNETVLIGEDNEAVRSLIRDVLQSYGYRTYEAVDGDDAVSVFKAHGKIDLVILDSVMPKKNGREAYEEISKADPHVRVLFISGHTRDIILDKGIADDEFDFLPKPISPVELLHKVREILDKD